MASVVPRPKSSQAAPPAVSANAAVTDPRAKPRINSFNRLALGPRNQPVVRPQPAHSTTKSSSPEPVPNLLPVEPWLEVTPTKNPRYGVEGLYRRIDLKVPQNILYVRCPTKVGGPGEQRFLWCRVGEWRFVASARHSETAILRNAVENLGGVPDSGWRRPVTDPDAGKTWAPAHILISVLSEPPMDYPEDHVDMLTSDGYLLRSSHFHTATITSAEMWTRARRELELGLLPLIKEVAAKNADKGIDVPSNGDILQRALDALQGIRPGASGKADAKISTLFARHGKAYNLVKYAAAVAEGARSVPQEDTAVQPDYMSNTLDAPGALETVVGDMVRLLTSCAGLSEASTQALEVAAANLQAWKALFLGQRTATLYAERGAAPYTQPLQLRRGGVDFSFASGEEQALDEETVLRRLLVIISDAVRAYLLGQGGSLPAGIGGVVAMAATNAAQYTASLAAAASSNAGASITPDAGAGVDANAPAPAAATASSVPPAGTSAAAAAASGAAAAPPTFLPYGLARLEDLHLYLAATAELVSPPSPTQTQLFSYFSDLLTLVQTSPLDSRSVFKWLSQHEVTDVATSWQQYEWISLGQLVKVSLMRAQVLLATWEDWLGAQQNLAILFESWMAIASSREMHASKHAPPRSAAGAIATGGESPTLGGIPDDSRESPVLLPEGLARRMAQPRTGGHASPLGFGPGSPQYLDGSPPKGAAKAGKRSSAGPLPRVPSQNPPSGALPGPSTPLNTSSTTANAATAETPVNPAPLPPPSPTPETSAAIQAAAGVLSDWPQILESLPEEHHAVMARVERALSDLLAVVVGTSGMPSPPRII